VVLEITIATSMEVNRKSEGWWLGGIQNLKFSKADIKVNLHFHWGVGRKGFVSDTSLCHVMI